MSGVFNFYFGAVADAITAHMRTEPAPIRFSEFPRNPIYDTNEILGEVAGQIGQMCDLLGRRRKLTTAQIAYAREAIEAGRETVTGMATLLKVERSTLWRALKRS
ncbi:MAG: Hin recombinase [Sphingobium sp.]|nr:Hin recombinase [Sphingobium sp.]